MGLSVRTQARLKLAATQQMTDPEQFPECDQLVIDRLDSGRLAIFEMQRDEARPWCHVHSPAGFGILLPLTINLRHWSRSLLPASRPGLRRPKQE